MAAGDTPLRLLRSVVVDVREMFGNLMLRVDLMGDEIKKVAWRVTGN
jgi:hypothetical protein